jgi:ribonucleoside-diphosphate reductase beta chain
LTNFTPLLIDNLGKTLTRFEGIPLAVEPPTDKTLAAFGAFTEGLQLFASFAILLSFPRFGKMRGMGQIITWSVRDESLHCESIIKLFRTFLDENSEVWTERLRDEINEVCRTIVSHEDAFIDLAFSAGEVKGITPEETKRYIRYIADRRLTQLGLPEMFKIGKNPLPWLDEMLNAVEHANFFENRATEYSKASTAGSWEEAFGDTPVRAAESPAVVV